MKGPYLPIYGIGALLLWHLLKRFKEKKHKILGVDITPIIIFIIVFFLTTIVEYLSHFVLDVFFNIKLWNYKNEFLNINGRVCFFASLSFAVGGTLALYVIQPFIEKFIYCKHDKIKDIIFIIFFISIVIDLLLKII